VAAEPRDREVDRPIERSRFLEEVRGALDNRKVVGAAQPPLGSAIVFEHLPIIASGDHQRWRCDFSEPRLRQVGPTPAQDDGADRAAEIRCGAQSRGRTGARANEAER
jgi:hypothetical protein